MFHVKHFILLSPAFHSQGVSGEKQLHFTVSGQQSEQTHVLQKQEDEMSRGTDKMHTFLCFLRMPSEKRIVSHETLPQERIQFGSPMCFFSNGKQRLLQKYKVRKSGLETGKSPPASKSNCSSTKRKRIGGNCFTWNIFLLFLLLPQNSPLIHAFLPHLH